VRYSQGDEVIGEESLRYNLTVVLRCNESVEYELLDAEDNDGQIQLRAQTKYVCNIALETIMGAIILIVRQK